MATYTSFLNLEKPTTSETFNLLKLNQNWDKIDQGVSSLNSNLDNIGSFVSTTEGSTNVLNETVTKLAEIQPSSGIYLIIANVSFPSNTTGARTVSLSTDSSLDVGWWQSVQASPFGSTGLQVMRYATFDGSNSIKLTARQTSGSTQSVTHRMFAIKLHN